MGADVREASSEEDVELREAGGSSVAVAEWMDPCDIDVCDDGLDDAVREVGLLLLAEMELPL